MEEQTFNESLIRFLQKLGREPDIVRILDHIVEYTKTAMDSQNVALIGVEAGLVGNWWVRSEGPKVTDHSMDVVRKAFLGETGYWIGGIAHDSEKASESQLRGDILSCLACKILLAEHTLGAIYCDVRSGDRRFTDEDGAELKLLADVFAVHIERARGALIKEQDKQQTRDKVPMIGETIVMKNLKNELLTAGKLTTSVLLRGESGVGKEVAAKLVHALSFRADKPFVPVNTSALPKDLAESELFGHEKGAFTGAFRKHQGLLELAAGGTLFLDEIGDMPPEIQAKLLRTLEDKCVRAVGGTASIPVDFRLICATNKDLKQMVVENTFRNDLYYRIAQLPIWIPSLKERIEDIPLLAVHFAGQGDYPKRIDDKALALLQAYAWPGNIRQLKTVVEQARDLTAGSVIMKGIIENQLKYQFPEPVGASHEVKLTFREIKYRWDAHMIAGPDLQSIIGPLYMRHRKNLNEVGRILQCGTPAELKAFRNWIYSRQKARDLVLT